MTASDDRFTQLEKLTDLFLACRACWNRSDRAKYIVDGLPDAARIEFSSTDLVYATNIVRVCLDSAAIYELLRKVHRITGDSRPWQNLEAYAAEQGLLYEGSTLFGTDQLQDAAKTIDALQQPIDTIRRIRAGIEPETRIRDRPTIAMLVAELAHYRAQADGLIPLLRFVSALVQQAVASPATQDAQAWLVSACADLGVEFGTATGHRDVGSRDSDEFGYLLMCIRRSDADGSSTQHARNDPCYNASAWYMPHTMGTTRRLDVEPSHSSCPYSELSTILDDFIDQALLYARQLVIEVIVPLELIDKEVDAWSINPFGDVKVPLGQRYPVVVRSYERLFSVRRWRGANREWEKRWAQLRDYQSRHACDAAKWEDDVTGSADAFYQRLCSHRTADGHRYPVLTACPSDSSFLGAILHAGMPIALWPRAPMDSARLQATLEPILNKHRLQELPTAIKELRCREDDCWLNNHLSLLWDDHDRRPPPADAPPLVAP
ncbi:MAG: hypothetical protein MJE77_42285 [Proteobacteria bacterium]|nr:hypothetical protein [Pseudomonadota bacterium]